MTKPPFLLDVVRQNQNHTKPPYALYGLALSVFLRVILKASCPTKDRYPVVQDLEPF